MLDILRQPASAGMAVLVVSDDVPELVAVCHRVLVFQRGRVAHELVGDDVDIAAIESGLAAWRRGTG